MQKKWAELLVPVLSDIKISWNGATKETHEKIMRDSKWENVTENLKTFLNVRDNYFNNTGLVSNVILQGPGFNATEILRNLVTSL